MMRMSVRVVRLDEEPTGEVSEIRQSSGSRLGAAVLGWTLDLRRRLRAGHLAPSGVVSKACFSMSSPQWSFSAALAEQEGSRPVPARVLLLWTRAAERSSAPMGEGGGSSEDRRGAYRKS